MKARLGFSGPACRLFDRQVVKPLSTQLSTACATPMALFRSRMIPMSNHHSSPVAPAELEARLRLHRLPDTGLRRFCTLLEAFGSASSALCAPAGAWRALGIPQAAIDARLGPRTSPSPYEVRGFFCPQFGLNLGEAQAMLRAAGLRPLACLPAPSSPPAPDRPLPRPGAWAPRTAGW